MDKDKRHRSCNRNHSEKSIETPRGSKQICIPLNKMEYDKIWHDAAKVSQLVPRLIAESPELFPSNIHLDYTLTSHLPESKTMPGVSLRQLRLNEGGTYTLRPSFVMSYMSGTVSEVEHPLLLLSLGVPYWAITMIYGHNEMYWHRHLERLGRNSLVGTTFPLPDRLPEILHHSQ